jgi:hypothetical protein
VDNASRQVSAPSSNGMRPRQILWNTLVSYIGRSLLAFDRRTPNLGFKESPAFDSSVVVFPKACKARNPALPMPLFPLFTRGVQEGCDVGLQRPAINSQKRSNTLRVLPHWTSYFPGIRLKYLPNRACFRCTPDYHRSGSLRFGLSRARKSSPAHRAAKCDADGGNTPGCHPSFL